MDGSVFNISREIVEEFISPQLTQAISHHYGQLIDSELQNAGAIPQDHNTTLEPEQVDFQTAEQGGFEQEVNPDATLSSFSVTRREIMLLSDILGRIL